MVAVLGPSCQRVAVDYAGQDASASSSSRVDRGPWEAAVLPYEAAVDAADG